MREPLSQTLKQPIKSPHEFDLIKPDRNSKVTAKVTIKALKDQRREAMSELMGK
jgi:hypothetical protein